MSMSNNNEKIFKESDLGFCTVTSQITHTRTNDVDYIFVSKEKRDKFAEKVTNYVGSDSSKITASGDCEILNGLIVPIKDDDEFDDDEE